MTMISPRLDTAEDLDTLARTIWAEARGDDIRSTPQHDGMEASAAVIMNRVCAAIAWVKNTGKRHPLYGDGTIKSACKMPWQFSCWNANDPNLPKLRAVDRTDPIFAKACEIAERASRGELRDPTGGATHYHTRAMGWPKAWGKQIAPCAEIGSHLFYKGV